MTKKMMTVMVVSVMFALLSSGPAFAALFTFVEGSQFHLDVVTGDDNDNGIGPYATFTVSNNGPASSAIAGIYFQDTDSLLNSYISHDFTPNGNGIFYSGVDPSNLPDGDPFGFSSNSYGFSARTASNNTNDGINTDESLYIIFNLAADVGYWDVINSMKSGSLRVGLYVINSNSNGADGMFNEAFKHDQKPIHTPIPGAAFLLGSGLTGLIFWKRRMQQQAS
jgi:hypothetical protein